MATFISRFQPGNCREDCTGPCCLCAAGTPTYMRATILGVNYILPFHVGCTGEGSAGLSCQWVKEVDQTIDCDTAGRIVLNLSQSGGEVVWTLQLFSTTDDLMRSWSLTETPDGDGNVDCSAVKTLPDITQFTEVCYPPADTSAVTITPSCEVSYSSCCGDCPDPCEEGSSGGLCVTCCGLGDDRDLYDADFGAGGWTDRTCDNCDGISGVFTLERTAAPCLWEYRFYPWCLPACFPSTCGGYYLVMVLQRVPTGGGNCKWVLELILYSPDTSSESSACVGVSDATYESTSDTPPHSCRLATPRTLTKVSEHHYGGSCAPCTGTLPATITLTGV